MLETLEPLKSDSLIEIFIRRFEELIISGKISIGQKLPSERDLALQLGISRPVVHAGLVELEAKGLVKIKPRSGAVVSDYRRDGSLPLLESLLRYSTGSFGPEILESMLSMRRLFETEIASLAAVKRSSENLKELQSLIDSESGAVPSDIEGIVKLDFSFHLLIAISSGNYVYPLLLNSFKDLYTNLTREFFRDSGVVKFVLEKHRELVEAVKNKDADLSVKIMTAIIDHGEKHLRRNIAGKNRKRND
jgi:DNA-binding FadR family transcriptional regulator